MNVEGLVEALDGLSAKNDVVIFDKSGKVHEITLEMLCVDDEGNAYICLDLE